MFGKKSDPQPIAAPGAVPQSGETWKTVGPKGLIFSQHLFPIDAVRPFVPAELKIIPVLPNRTIGFLCLAYYGPGSSVQYHELTVMSALVAYGWTWGLWVSHIYVDNEISQQGGREVFGLPKQMAQFDWEGGRPGKARVLLEGRELISIAYGRPAFSINAPIGGRAICVAPGNRVIFSTHRLAASYGLTRMRIHVPADSELAALRFSRPLLRLVGGPMTGLLGDNQRELGRLEPTT